MSCIVKSFSKKVQEKHNLSPYFAEFFFQLYNIKYGENSEFDENKFDELVNSYKNRDSFIVDDNGLYDTLNNYINEQTDNGYIEYDRVTASVKNHIKKLEDSFGKENVFAWTDKNGKVHIKLNEPSLNGYTQEMLDIKEKALKDGTFMKAPNGKPTNLNEKQWLQVRTKAFKEWFGDWENDAKNASKVVDENGEPLVVYHGTTNNFNIFNKHKNGIYFTSDEQYAEDIALNRNKFNENYFVVSCFLNIRNPLTINDVKDIEESYNFTNYANTSLVFGYRNMEIAQKNGIINKHDGAIGQDIPEGFSIIESIYKTKKERDKEFNEKYDNWDYYTTTERINKNGDTEYLIIAKHRTISNGTEYVVFNPNQIKSATDNVGTFSKENNDIRYNLTPVKEIFDFLTKTKLELLHQTNEKWLSNEFKTLAHKFENGYWITKLPEEIKGEKVYSEELSKQIVDDFLKSINLDKVFYTQKDGNGTKIFFNKEEYKNIKESHENLNDIKIINNNKIYGVLGFLSDRLKVPFHFISIKEAKELLGDGYKPNLNAFNLNNEAYFIKDARKEINVDIKSEEMLHPFVASLKKYNIDIFNDLLNDARKNYAKLHVQIRNTYLPEQVDEELVTQALARAFVEEKKGNPLKRTKEFLNKFLSWVVNFLTGNNELKLHNFTLDEIAKVINSDIEIKYKKVENNFNQNLLKNNITEEQAAFTQDNIENLSKSSEELIAESAENNITDTKVEVDENSIFAKIHRWKAVNTLTSKEKQELSDSLIKNFSYWINGFYNNPDSIDVLDLDIDNKTIKKIAKKVKAGKMTREQFIKSLSYSSLLKNYKKYVLFNAEFNKKEIDENWDAIIFNGRHTLSETEGMTISPKGLFDNVSDKLYDLYENPEVFEGKEEEEIDAYNIENDRRSVSSSLSQEIRTLINLIPIQDSYTKWNGYRFEDGDAICKKILEICSSANSYRDMINRLEARSDVYDWIKPLLNKVENSKNLRQLFFKNFKKNFIKRAIIRRTGNGFEPLVINYDDEITKIKKENFEWQWNAGFNSMFFTFTGKKEKSGKSFGYGNIDEINEKKANLRLYKNIGSFDIILKNLGFEINIDLLKKVLSDENTKETLIDNIENILDVLSEIKEDNPLVPTGKIKKYAVKIYKSIEKYDPIYVESSTVQMGKNFYGYVYPSFLNDMFDKLNNVESLENDEYIESLKSVYQDDYLIDKDGNARNLLLRDLINDKEFREAFEKVSLLHIDTKEIKFMSAKDLFLSQLAMFTDSKAGKEYARYSCGIFSNKAQQQFITYRRFKSLEDTKDSFYEICLQELDRIRDVISRANDDSVSKVQFYDIDKSLLKNIKDINNLSGKDLKALLSIKKPNGASFKHLSFLNNILFDDKNEIGKTFRDYINNGNSNLLKESFLNLFDANGVFEQFFTEQRNWLFDNDLVPVDEQGNQRYSDETIQNFVINNFIAQIQFSQLFQIDTAYNKNAEDTQKRAAAWIAPGLKLDVNATFREGNMDINFSDGIMRTVVIQKQKVVSDTIKALEKIFDEKVEEFFPGTKEQANVLGKVLITRLKKVYNEVDANDGQSWMSPTGYWKKLGMQGENTDEVQEIINRISNGDLNINDINAILGEPVKPVVYGFQKMNYADKDFTFKRKLIPTYIKDSEVTILLADAIIRDAKQNSILTGLFDLMEESHYNKTQWNNGDLKGKRGEYKDNGIDNITMSSAVKTGLKGAIDISDEAIKNYIEKSKKKLTKSQAVKEIIKNKIYNKDGSYNPEYLIQTSFEDYRIQQEVPPHLRNHKQQMGSQPRVLMPIDIQADDEFILDGKPIKGIDLQEEYFDLLAQYYQLTKKDVENKFGLANDKKKRIIENIANKAKDLSTEEIVDGKKTNPKINYIYSALINAVKVNELSLQSAFGRKCNTYQKLKEAVNKKESLGGLFAKIYNNVKLDDSDLQYSEAERKMFLSNILIEQINADSRYDIELMDAVSINPETGEFNVPFNDPINHNRIEQLICSIIKKIFVKQNINGGPVVQASSYGLDNKLNIRYYMPNSNELLMTKSEFEKQKNTGFDSYDDYVNFVYTDENGESITPIIAYHEIAITIPWSSTIADKLIIKEGDRKGQLMTPQEAVKAGIITDEMLYSIGYRIPTENKSSIYPMKIVGFIPEGIGTQILLPEEITAITGSDFDIDKTYIMFKSFNSDENGNMIENKDLTTKGGINNRMFDMHMSIFHSPKTQYLLHNPQGFEDIRRAQLIPQIGKFAENKLSYEQLQLKTTNELEDILDELSKNNTTNIHSIDTQLTFFEKNMQGAQVLGMFASSNTAHAFCQIHNQFLQKDGRAKMSLNVDNLRLDGQIFDDKNKLVVDDIYNRNRTMYISTAMGEFVGAAADIVKDDVLTNFSPNLNSNSVNIINLLIRCGFPHDFVSMVLNQPIAKEILKSDIPINYINNYKAAFKKNNKGKVSYDEKTKTIIYDSQYKFTTSELFNHLNDDIDSNEYQYYIADIMFKLINASKDFLTLSLETRYNSIKNAVGPSIIDNILVKQKHDEFINNDNFKINNAQDIVKRNPLLNILYEEQYGNGVDKNHPGSLLQRILGKTTVEYDQTFINALNRLRQMYSKYFTKDDIQLINTFMNDWSYFRLTGMNPFINQNLEERKRIYNFPERFAEFKAYCISHEINNDFVNLLYLDRYGNLCMNTKKMKAEHINHIKFSLEELYKSKDETLHNFAKDAFYYFLQKQGFDFDPNGDVKIFPEYIKKDLGFYNYTAKSSYGIPKNSNWFVDLFLIQFFRNHSEIAPRIKMTKTKENRVYKTGNNNVVLDTTNKKVIIKNNGKDTFNSFVRDEYDDQQGYIPIFRLNYGDLYAFPQIDENGDLVYTNIYSLGNDNFREYNAQESPDNPMQTIATKERLFIRKDRIIDDYKPTANSSIPKDTMDYLQKLYNDVDTSTLKRMYNFEQKSDKLKFNMKYDVTPAVKKEIEKMVKPEYLKEKKLELKGKKLVENNEKDDSVPTITPKMSINTEKWTEKQKGNEALKKTIAWLKNMTAEAKDNNALKLFVNAIENRDIQYIKDNIENLKSSPSYKFNPALRKSGDKFWKFVDDFVNDKLENQTEKYC